MDVWDVLFAPLTLVFPVRVARSLHLPTSTRQYSLIVHRCIREIGLDSGSYGTHTMLRAKASLICLYRSVVAIWRATSRAASLIWRAILRCVVLGQHNRVFQRNRSETAVRC